MSERWLRPASRRPEPGVPSPGGAAPDAGREATDGLPDRHFYVHAALGQVGGRPAGGEPLVAPRQPRGVGVQLRSECAERIAVDVLRGVERGEGPPAELALNTRTLAPKRWWIFLALVHTARKS